MNINYTVGYAGTGKSTELLNYVKQVPLESAVVICPTHKAIDRLRPNLPDLLEVKTIHALLGWVPSINENATHINHIDTTIKLDHPLGEYSHIIIDEAGMMSEDMFMDITGKLEEENSFETDHITLSLYLDPYQLLPVKGQQIQLDPETTTRLTTQHRAESPDVVALFTKFVNYLEGTNAKDLVIENSENVSYLRTIENFRKGDRLLAYTNECVGKYNLEIASQLGIRDYIGQEVQLGNKSRSFVPEKYLNPSIDDLINLYENGYLYLQNSQINKKFLKSSLQALIDCKDIDFVQIGRLVVPVIIGINNSYLAIKKAKALAVEDKKNFKWVYALGRAFTMDYTFASTVHKAQGSEFDRVWIVKSDIQKAIVNGYYNNYARMMYVAISRARKTVFVLP